MKFSDTYMTVAMLIIFTVMVTISSHYPPGARFMTFVVGMPAIGLCLLQLFIDFRNHRRGQANGHGDLSKAEDEASRLLGHPVHLSMPVIGPEISPEEKVRRELIIWGYILGLVGGILLFGFHVAVPIFILTFLRFQAKASWLMAAGMAAAATVFMYVLFEHVFRMTLHPGFIPEYLMDRISG